MAAGIRLNRTITVGEPPKEAEQRYRDFFTTCGTLLSGIPDDRSRPRKPLGVDSIGKLLSAHPALGFVNAHRITAGGQDHLGGRGRHGPLMWKQLGNSRMQPNAAQGNPRTRELAFLRT